MSATMTALQKKDGGLVALRQELLSEDWLRRRRQDGSASKLSPSALPSSSLFQRERAQIASVMPSG